MRDRLLEWMRATEDPLLHGPVPEPPGAWSNDPAQASPNDPTSEAER
jgi:N-sulfoglucosamine sulfohydrolase